MGRCVAVGEGREGTRERYQSPVSGDDEEAGSVEPKAAARGGWGESRRGPGDGVMELRAAR